MALHTVPTLAKAKDTKASAIVSAIDASVGVTVGLSSNTVPRASPYHARAVGAEPNNAVGGIAMALHTGPALAEAKDAKAFTIISAVDTSISITCGLPNNTVPRASPQHTRALRTKAKNATLIRCIRCSDDSIIIWTVAFYL
jgi:hypothetical protein